MKSFDTPSMWTGTAAESRAKPVSVSAMTVLETRTSPAPAMAEIRAPMCTAIPFK